MNNSSQLKFSIIKKQSCYSGYFQLNRYHLKHQLFNGNWSETLQREVFERGHAAGVLLLDPTTDTLVLIEQFRAGALEMQSNPWMIEVVAGIIEATETPETLVARESIEEAGCQIKRLQPIAEYLPSAGACTEKVWLFLGQVDANQAEEYAGLQQENEDIKIHKIPVETAFQQLEQGKFNNAMLLIALQWLKLNWHNKHQFWQ